MKRPLGCSASKAPCSAAAPSHVSSTPYDYAIFQLPRLLSFALLKLWDSTQPATRALTGWPAHLSHKVSEGTPLGQSGRRKWGKPAVEFSIAHRQLVSFCLHFCGLFHSLPVPEAEMHQSATKARGCKPP